MLLAVLSVWVDRRDGALPKPLVLIARFPSLCFAIAIMAIWFGATQIGLTGSPAQLYSPTQYLIRHLLNSTIGVALVFAAVFGDSRKGLTRRVLANPALIYIGVISYGFYLFHFAVITQLFHWKFYNVHFAHPYLRWYVAALIGAVLFGSASYYLVERPALTLKRLVRPRPPTSRDDEVAEPAPVATLGAPPAG
jgi:peptidoglycan/LPS O-acetylase OafA/YrhL